MPNKYPEKRAGRFPSKNIKSPIGLSIMLASEDEEILLFGFLRMLLHSGMKKIESMMAQAHLNITRTLLSSLAMKYGRYIGYH